jgi:hypothetical protein
VSWRPWLEDRALRQMQGLPTEAFDILVQTLVRICDDPFDPVFSAPVPPCRAGASLTWATSVSSSSSPMRRRDWSAFITWCGPVSDRHIAAIGDAPDRRLVPRPRSSNQPRRRRTIRCHPGIFSTCLITVTMQS